jgi:hypothetical protein
VVGAFDEEVAQEQAKKAGPYINTIKWSVPVYTVPADQPTVKVTLENATAHPRHRASHAPGGVGSRPVAGGCAARGWER